MRSILVIAIIGALSLTSPTLAQQHGPQCQTVYEKDFLASVPENTPILRADKAVAFGRDAKWDNAEFFIAVFLAGPTLIILTRIDGATVACVSTPDADDIVAIRKYFGTRA